MPSNDERPTLPSGLGSLLEVPITEPDRDRLIQTTLLACRRQGGPRLTDASAAALDRVAETGFTDQQAVPMLGALAPPDQRDILKQATLERIADAERASPDNPFALPLPVPPDRGSGAEEDSDPPGLRPWLVARIIGMAAAAVLAVSFFFPQFIPGGSHIGPTAGHHTIPRPVVSPTGPKNGEPVGENRDADHADPIPESADGARTSP